MSASSTNPTDTPYQLDAPLNLSEADRKLLVRGSLRLMLGRLDRGYGVYADDLIRIAPYAPDRERTLP